MIDASTDGDEAATALLALYDTAVSDVYSYLIRRCGSPSIAEDLTSETFLAAVDAVRRGRVPAMTVAWLIGVARHKLVDNWRRAEREERMLRAVEATSTESEDDWDVVLNATRSNETLARLAPQHRGALILRYLDGLPVSDVADHLGRTIGATEVLLVRARRAFRTAYEAGGEAP